MVENTDGGVIVGDELGFCSGMVVLSMGFGKWKRWG
jgi:hypothetical protein